PHDQFSVSVREDEERFLLRLIRSRLSHRQRSSVQTSEPCIVRILAPLVRLRLLINRSKSGEHISKSVHADGTFRLVDRTLQREQSVVPGGGGVHPSLRKTDEIVLLRLVL